MAVTRDVARLPGWTPVRVHAERGTLEWRFTGDLPFDEPFFSDTVQRALRRPYAVLFAEETPLDELASRDPGGGELPLAGLVLHTSRCGSTLVSRLLRAIPGFAVLSEPPPVDDVLRAHFRVPGLSRQRQVSWLRAVVAGLSRQRRPREERLVLKLDPSSAVGLPLLLEAFPGVPWVFVHRSPVDVLVSQMRRRGLHTIPGVLEPELFGLAPGEPERLSPETYTARVLAAILRAVLEAPADGRLLVSYEELPGAVAERVAPHFGRTADETARAEMALLAQADAKNPLLPFERDVEEKRGAASPEILRAAAEWVDPLQRRLEERTGRGRACATYEF